jgi:hypothetical protein
MKNVSQTIQLLEDLERLESELDTVRSRLLESYGWEYTCQTPGSVWLWQKVVDGKTLLVTESVALDFTRQSLLDQDDF